MGPVIDECCKATYIYYLMVSVGQQSRQDPGTTQAGPRQVLRVSHEAAIQVVAGAGVSSESSAGERRTSKLIWLLGGCNSLQVIGLGASVSHWTVNQKPPSVPCHIGLPIGHLIHGILVHQSQQGGESTSKTEARSSCHLLMEVTPHPVWCSSHSLRGEAEPVVGIDEGADREEFPSIAVGLELSGGG